MESPLRYGGGDGRVRVDSVYYGSDDPELVLGPSSSTMIDGLPRLHVDAARRQAYEDMGDDLIQRALEEHHAFHSSAAMHPRWKLVRQRDALSVYKHRTPVAPLAPGAYAASCPTGLSSSRSSLMMGSGFLPGTLHDALAGVYCDTTESLRVVKSILSGRFLDGAMVHVFERHSLDAPISFSGIKWFAVASPANALIHDRDLLCFERMGRIVDTEGNYFAYHVLQSITLPEWPAYAGASAAALGGGVGMAGGLAGGMERRGQLRRAYLSMCYLYRQVADHWVGCFILGDFDPSGSVTSSISDFVVADMMLSVGNVLECAHAKRFSALIHQHAAHCLPVNSRRCTICQGTPGLFKSADRALQLCVGCHKRVCRRCRLRCTIFRLSLRRRRPQKEWFCRECVSRVVVGPPRRNDWAHHSPDDEDHDDDGHPYDRGETGNVYDEPDEELPSPAFHAPGSVRSDKNSRLRDMDIEALAALTEQWRFDADDDPAAYRESHLPPQHRTIKWNAEELARLSGRLNSSRVQRHAEAKCKQKIANPLTQSFQSGVQRLFGKSKSASAAAPVGVEDQDVDRSSRRPRMSRDDSDLGLGRPRGNTTSWVPGNSYNGGGSDWSANCVKLNAAVSTTPPAAPSSASPAHSTHKTAQPKGSTAASATAAGLRSPPRKNSSASTASGSRAHRSRRPPPSDDEMRRLYAQFMDAMARNRAAAQGQSPHGAHRPGGQYDYDQDELHTGYGTHQHPRRPQHHQHHAQASHHYPRSRASTRHPAAARPEPPNCFSVDELD